MEINNREQLKQYFKTNKRPTEAEFANLIDSVALKSEIPLVEAKPYKVFSALLRIENMSTNPVKPIYELTHRLLEPNTIGELNVYLSSNMVTIECAPGEGLLAIDRRFITLGVSRMDYNFINVVESDDYMDDSIFLFFDLKSGETQLMFYNLPIEIRIYNEVEIELPFPSGPLSPGIPLPNPSGTEIHSENK